MVALFGRANWWLPSWMARLLRVPASAVPVTATRSVDMTGARGGEREVSGVR
jgi:hypothetical protein